MNLEIWVLAALGYGQRNIHGCLAYILPIILLYHG